MFVIIPKSSYFSYSNIFGMKNLFIALMISKHAWSKQSDKVPNVVFQQLVVAMFHLITWRICGNNIGVWLQQKYKRRYVVMLVRHTLPKLHD